MKSYLVGGASFVVSLLIGLGFMSNDITLPTPSATAVPSITPTFIPARDLDLLSTFETLMTETKEDCVLPCWWGLKPGETTLEETADFLRKTGFNRHQKYTIYSSMSLEDYLRVEQFVLYFLDNSYFAEFAMSFGFDKDDRIRGVSLRFSNPSLWLPSESDTISLPKILTEIEETPEIYIAENPSTFNISEYHLILLYRNRGVEVNYTFNLSDDNPKSPIKNLNLCLDNRRTKSIEMSLLSSSFVLNYNPFPDYFKTPANATGIGINTEDFVQFFKTHPDECLDVSAYQNGK